MTSMHAKAVDDGELLALASARREVVLEVLQGCNGRRGGLIAILEAIQERQGYLSEEALRIVSKQTGRSLVDIYGVATFYRSFSLKPRGRHLICLCLGTACHVRGGPRILDEFERRLEIKAGETTPDGEFTLETVNCLGACALGPVVVVDGQYYANVDGAGVKRILREVRAKAAPCESSPAGTSCEH